MNRIVYGNCEFTDADINSAEVILSNAMVAENLSADEFTFTAHVNDDGYLKTVFGEYYLTTSNERYKILGNRPTSFIYGTPVEYYKDDELQGRFYLESGARIGRDLYEFHCVSAVGLLIRIPHEGGVYENAETTVGDLVRSIFAKIGFVENTDYTIENEVAELPVNGWLPYSNCRDNLKQILFAVGASIVKSNNGDFITIKFISSPTIINIQAGRTYQEGEVFYLAPASRVEVWEHEYHAFADDEVVVLFDNAGKGQADHDIVTFREPCHSFTTTGTLTYSEIGANYAIVTGEGSLSGKKYTHTTNVVVENIEETLTGNEKSNVVEVKDATLISSINSYNCTKRVAEYYKQKSEVRCGIVLAQDGLKPSSQVSFINSFGEEANGYVKSMDITISGINRAETVIATDWTPRYFGNSFGESVLITSGNSWVATRTGRVKIVIIGAGTGGSGGGNGTGGNAGEFELGSVSGSEARKINHGVGGKGGAKGTGGQQGKVLVIEADVEQGHAYAISIGQGGAGGASGGGIGAIGGNTTITIDGTVYSSANGIIYDNGYVDAFTGDVYASAGWDGIAGQDANQNAHARNSTTPVKVQVQVASDKFEEFELKAGSPSTTGGTGKLYSDTSYDCYAFDADGGGGAFTYPNAQGGDATAPHPLTQSAFNYYAGKGGAGANAINLKQYIDSQYNTKGLTLDLKPGTGGCGGNGGGGGGGGGDANTVWLLPSGVAHVGYGGIGGFGSTGVAGANGGILIYI